MKKIILIGCIAIVATTGVIISSLRNKSAGSEEVADTLIGSKLQKQDIEESINITGYVRGDEVSVGNSQSSECVDIKVNNGDYVNEGDILFIFDTTDLQYEYDKAVEKMNSERQKADYYHSVNEQMIQTLNEAQNISLSQAQSQIDFAQRMLDDANAKIRSLTSDKENLIAQKEQLSQQLIEMDAESAEKEIISTEYASVSSKIETVTAELSSLSGSCSELARNLELANEQYANIASEYQNKISEGEKTINEEKYQTFSVDQNSIDSIQKKIDKCVVKAPVSGIISDISVCKGAVPIGGELAKIVNTSDYHVEASLSEKKVVMVKNGMDVAVMTASTGENEIKGVIKSISSLGTNGDNGVTYAVDIDIPDDIKEKPMLNMTAIVRIVQGVVKNTYAVPYEAILSDEDGDYILEAVEYKGHYMLKRIDVEKGVNTNFLCEIKSSELNEDMLIITQPMNYDEEDIVDIDIE